jgi:hypothetical protein
MVDYTGLNVNVYDLLNENDFQYFSEENIIGNILVYGPDKPSLIPNHDYAVRVRAYLLDGSLNMENGGFSDVVQFHYNQSNNFPIDFLL